MKQTGRRDEVICKDGRIVKVIKISEILGDWGIPVIPKEEHWRACKN
jgi:hypothetical protein